ncbi:site-specific integrase [Pseudoalteromonas sp. SA25]|uniref:site-specific integrase n=1 Tax=Pseudoalteromonas sp. SA25 TaxID=2686347 RepID=UPI0013FDC577|nr:site-specific integrase [Pseudoalteromonas sp. SA25]
MSEQTIKELTNSISNYLASAWPYSTTQEAILWILNHSPIINKRERSLDKIELDFINRQLNTIVTGKRQVYREALEGVLFYLGNECQWQLPEAVKEKVTDANHQYFEELAKGSAHAQQIFACYQQHKTHFFDTRTSLTPCFIALMIGFEIAPFSLTHICAILNNHDSITNEVPNPRLAITHNACGGDDPRVTHYHIPVVCHQLLHDYYAQSLKQLCPQTLYTSLTQWLQTEGLSRVQESEWFKHFQVSWYIRFQLPPIFIKDLAYPERHVGLPQNITESVLKATDIYDIDWDTTWFESLKKSRTKTHWPHEILLKNIENLDVVEYPPLDATNILPRMLFDYTKQLIVYGGVKKAELALGSIRNYTSLKSRVEPFPLSYADAIAKETVNSWAQAVYKSIDSNAVKIKFYTFLRFLSYQEQTDSLDLSHFESPIMPPSVSAARLSVDECDLLIEALINKGIHHPFRNLFCVIAALLGFYAMLRRGEILRLRRKDIRFKPSTGLLTVTVTNTAEGNTKSDTPRKVHTTLPKQYRQLFIYLFEVKKNSPREQPLLGFEGEKYHSRQLYYLLPVSRALRCLFGTHINFHHLRHSGVHIFMLQTLHCLNSTPDNQRGKTSLELEILSSESVAIRFDYWFEGRTVREVNDAIFLDEMGTQIGHIYYGTTRWSYLHDIDWLLPIISPAHCMYTRHGRTHSEVCYLLGLKPNSNDLSRILLKLSPEYARKTRVEKRCQHIFLSDYELKEAMFGKAKVTTISSSTVKHSIAWQQSICDSEHTILGFIFKSMFKNKVFDLGSLSFIWEKGSRHHIQPLPKKQRTALNYLPPVILSDDKQSLQITLACNTKNAHAFNTVFRQADWGWLNFEFTLCVNRKIKSERQITLLKTQFACKKEDIRIYKHPIGATKLTISLIPKMSLSNNVLKLTEYFIKSFQLDEAQQ